MLLFFVGMIEMLIIAAWTKTVIGARVVASGAISFINVLIWYYVLNTVIANIDNISIVFLYAAGCASGTMLSGVITSLRNKEKQAFEEAPVLVPEYNDIT
jgi:uncharacterized protein YebE (UPF0316 family)